MKNHDLFRFWCSCHCITTTVVTSSRRCWFLRSAVANVDAQNDADSNVDADAKKDGNNSDGNSDSDGNDDFRGCYLILFLTLFVGVGIDLKINYFCRYRKKKVEIIRMKVMMWYILTGGSVTKYFEFYLTNEAVMLLFFFFQKVLLLTVKIQNIEHDNKSWMKRILWRWCTHQYMPECLWMMIRSFNSGK